MPSMRLSGLALVAAITLLVASCAPNGEQEVATPTDDDDDDTDSAVEAEEEDVSEEEVVLVYGDASPSNQPHVRCGAALLPELLEEADVGLTVDVFPDGQLGQADAMRDAVMAGELDIAVAGHGQLSTVYEPMSVFNAVYLFDSRSHAETAFESDVVREMDTGMVEEAGLRILARPFAGTRQLYSNDRMIHSPADLDGFRLRVVDAPIYTDGARAMGASPTPVAFDELYLALQQGLVDGAESPIPQLGAMAFYEVADYVNITNHSFEFFPIYIGEESWQSLSTAQKEALQDAMDTIEQQIGACTEEDEAEWMDQWRSEDSDFIVNDDVDIEAFQEAAAEFLPPRWDEVWGGAYQEIRDMAD